VNRQIVLEAAEWFVELNAGPTPDLETRKEFDKWLRASPEHVRAFLEIVPIWEDGSQLPQDSDTTPQRLVEWARRAGNVMSMQNGDRPQRGLDAPLPQPRSPNRSFRRIWAAGLASVLVGIAIVLVYSAVRYPTYATGIGEQRSLKLADNSVIELNALSRVRVRYSEHERVIELLEGQALFRVAKNAERPFIVHSAGTKVRAVGTEFDVYRKTTGTVITVVEGRVSVDADFDSRARDGGHHAASRSATPAEGGSQMLAAGEQLTLGPRYTRKAEHANIAGATAWTQRQLVFDSTPLPEVAEEFNRYTTRRLSVDATHLEDFRISGIFSSTDPASLIRFLREQPGVQVTESKQEIRVSGSSGEQR
jgi:transmembrane sensor